MKCIKCNYQTDNAYKAYIPVVKNETRTSNSFGTTIVKHIGKIKDYKFGVCNNCLKKLFIEKSLFSLILITVLSIGLYMYLSDDFKNFVQKKYYLVIPVMIIAVASFFSPFLLLYNLMILFSSKENKSIHIAKGKLGHELLNEYDYQKLMKKGKL